MRRMILYVAVAAAGFGIYLLVSGADAGAPGGAHAAMSLPATYAGWSIGLVMGLLIGWAGRIDWRTLPLRAAFWLRLQRRRLWLVMLGGALATFLLLF